MEMNTQAARATMPEARLERPWLVFLFGILLSTVFLGIMYVRVKAGSPLDVRAARGVIGFAVWAVLMSGSYAYLGASRGKARANRVVGSAGLAVALGTIVLLLWAMLMHVD